MKRYIFFCAALSALFLAGAAEARDQIRIVGSSTVYPFTTTVAENFGKSSGQKTPIVESTGTGGGMKLFCGGVGVDHPDITNASRRIKKGELETCQQNGVTDIVELNIGYDGLTLAQSKSAKLLQLTLGQIYLALAKEVPGPDGMLIPNPHVQWADIDPSLPAVKIEVLGPPPTSGTRDSLHELFMEKGAEQIEAMKMLKEADAKAYEKAWRTLREDGAYVEAGENDNVIVQKLEANPNAVGIFGYSFLEENTSRLQGVPLGGVEPTFENIASGDYKGGRPLYVYFKKQHIGVIPGIQEFAEEYISPQALGEDGYLAAKGLVPLPADLFEKEAAKIRAMEPMKADELS
ncbi:MAG TPA: substrate-binding domain-containing protein [Aestuariivirgaceae bacterium]|jgi:phosphate transport system substrate-binding protein